MEFILARTSGEFNAGKRLFMEYAQHIGIDLGFQNFHEELTHIAEQYGPPAGGLILSKVNQDMAGCIGIRKFQGSMAEVKRMYVREEYRNQGIGKSLLLQGMHLAKSLDYKILRLDTLPSMHRAVKLYAEAGFKEIAPYRYNPVEGAKYFELDLKEVKM